MDNNALEIWWSSLPIAQKERIARKAASKAAAGGTVDESLVQYPACTRWWNDLPVEKKQEIYDHCVDRHGLLLAEWNDAAPYGD